jgi:hypothetical protein
MGCDDFVHVNCKKLDLRFDFNIDPRRAQPDFFRKPQSDSIQQVVFTFFDDVLERIKEANGFTVVVKVVNPSKTRDDDFMQFRQRMHSSNGGWHNMILRFCINPELIAKAHNHFDEAKRLDRKGEDPRIAHVNEDLTPKEVGKNWAKCIHAFILQPYAIMFWKCPEIRQYIIDTFCLPRKKVNVCMKQETLEEITKWIEKEPSLYV